MNDLNGTLRITSFAHGDARFAGAAEVRRKVFMEEQGYGPDEEWDEHDLHSVHYLALLDDEPVGVLRWWDDGGWFRIGRLAVLPAFRGRGLARRLMRTSLEECAARGYARSFLNAQADKQAFYQSLGYRPVGETFFEGPILHQRMEMNF